MLNATLCFLKQPISKVKEMHCFNKFKFQASQVSHKKCKCPAPWHVIYFQIWPF